MSRVKWLSVFVEDKDKHKLDISDYSGNVFLVKAIWAFCTQLTSLVEYRCLKLSDRAKSWKAPLGVMTQIAQFVQELRLAISTALVLVVHYCLLFDG